VGSPLHTYEVALPNDRSIAMQDYNGDGRDDILIASVIWDNSASVQSANVDEWDRPNGFGAWALASIDLLRSQCTSQQIDFDQDHHVPPIGLPYFKTPGRFMTIGDFDADGKTEAMVIFNDLIQRLVVPDLSIR